MASSMVAMGREGVPLAIADDAHADPQALRAAANRAPFVREEGDFYPGLRAPVPEDYAGWLAATARVLWGAGPLAVARSSYAIAIDAPAALAPIQRIPHFDTLDPATVAAVHYLSDADHGGTLFYRHRRTGYERIDAARHPAWRQALMRDGAEHGLPAPRYFGESGPGFDSIGHAEWRCNRLILYPANCLHAGDLGKGALSADPALGRLTITSLLRPADAPPE